jgi:hypothetical protein
MAFRILKPRISGISTLFENLAAVDNPSGKEDA